ncbi:MAG TPA: hypothetical protein VG742_04885 [Dongiaceae bacterium]|nr:hypothetical protein [Dongiaceae bacterium]
MPKKNILAALALVALLAACASAHRVNAPLAIGAAPPAHQGADVGADALRGHLN